MLRRKALAGAPRTLLADPLADRRLAHFVCGDASERASEALEIVRRLREDHRPEGLQVLIAEDHLADPDAPPLAGLCAMHWRPLHDASLGAMYIGVIAVAAEYRGARLPSGESVGDVLMGRSLAALDLRFAGMPPVWALLHPDDTPSQRLLDRHQFRHVSTRRSQFWYRPASAPLPS